MLENLEIEKSLGLYISKANKTIGKRINGNFCRSGYDITHDHWTVLAHLWMKDGQNQQALCEFAQKSKTTISRIIDDLEKQSFVLRVPDILDRRNKLIYLTHKGKSSHDELRAIMIQSLEEATLGIDSLAIEVCKKVLNQVILNLGNFAPNSQKD